MIRNLTAVIVGLAVGMVANQALLGLNNHFYPLPEGVNPMKAEHREAFKAHVASLPATGFVLVILAHQAQAFLGGLLAALISRTRPMTCALIVGVLSMAGGIMAIRMFGGPWWMWLEVPLYLVSAWAAVWAATCGERRS